MVIDIYIKLLSSQTPDLTSSKDLFKKQILNNLWLKVVRIKLKRNISKSFVPQQFEI